MSFLHILIIVGVAIFAIVALTYFSLIIYLVSKVAPQIKKEDYLMDHGYYFDKGYWYKEDLSLTSDCVHNMSFARLRDYLEQMEWRKDHHDW